MYSNNEKECLRYFLYCDILEMGEKLILKIMFKKNNI